jgi:hypothetical protein
MRLGVMQIAVSDEWFRPWVGRAGRIAVWLADGSKRCARFSKTLVRRWRVDRRVPSCMTGTIHVAAAPSFRQLTREQHKRAVSSCLSSPGASLAHRLHLAVRLGSTALSVELRRVQDLV